MESFKDSQVSSVSFKKGGNGTNNCFVSLGDNSIAKTFFSLLLIEFQEISTYLAVNREMCVVENEKSKNKPFKLLQQNNHNL